MGPLQLASVCLRAVPPLVSLFAIWHVIGLFRHRRGAPRLADLPDDAPAGGWPTLAVIFAARDEAQGVERATRSLLAQDYPGLQVIAVDDRSADGTGAILDQLAAVDARLRVRHVTELPAGWLGKNNALHVAAQSTDADWLLFTDADVVFAPGSLRRAIAEAIRTGAHHVTVIPQVPTEGPGERLFMSMFLLMFSFHAPHWRVHNPRTGTHLGIGAFNMVRASVYRAIGGFGGLRLTVDEDVRLGRVLKTAGFRTRVLLGGDTVSVRWQFGLGGMIRGMEKNFFAAADFRVVQAAAGGVALLVVGAAPHVGLFIGPWWSRAICAAGVAAVCAIVAAAGRQNGMAWYYGLTMPVSAGLVVFSLVRSTWFTLLRGGVSWRKHHYPLAALRDHARDRNAWIRELRTARLRTSSSEPPAGTAFDYNSPPHAGLSGHAAASAAAFTPGSASGATERT